MSLLLDSMFQYLNKQMLDSHHSFLDLSSQYLCHKMEYLLGIILYWQTT